ncbi:PIP5K9 [Symbiodinium necroappetens]|uniref:PIP5K9 protein n=1 Tax=Symbiodinium necroappetens TaxID=1628268 RepID=A0A812JWI9_9DINO|nr:PIP5K9 [Symbiodinium necroappetens]
MAGAARASYDNVAKWSRPTTWPARKRLPERGPNAPHVVLSTKFEEPWYTVSIGIKEVLEELGCTVYNPSTDNKERYGDEADDRWLRTFCENLSRIQREKRGFVLQIQQGMAREKSDMQIAEEEMGTNWRIPRMGMFAFPTTKWRGGGTPAQAWRWFRSGSSPLRTTGSCASTTRASSRAELGEGGQRAKSTRGSGRSASNGKDKGRAVRLSADRRQAWLLMDGKKEREVSVAEAGGPRKQRKRAPWE